MLNNFNDEYVSVPCPEGKPGCAVNHIIPKEEYDKIRNAQKKASAEWTRQYEKGLEDGRKELALSILNWIEAHRQFFELDDEGSGFYRDHYSTESLIEFIKEKSNE